MRTIPRALPWAIVVVMAMFEIAAYAQLRAPKSLATLAQEGSDALDEKRYGDALDAFTQAIKLESQDASLHLGAGIAAFMLGNGIDARAWLERALTLAPRYTEAARVLGLVLYRAGNVTEAIRVYETALKYTPGDDDLNTALEQWRKEDQLQGRFYQAQGAHFLVLFEGPSDDVLARRVVEMLDQAYYRLGTTLYTYPTRTVTVVLYTGEQFRDITRSPVWAGGVFDGRIKIPIRDALDQSEELQRVLEHELVHATVATIAGPAMPTWLNEGLATALEPGGIEWANAQLAGDPTRIAYARLTTGFNRLSAREAGAAYAQSALAVKAMMDLRGAPAVVSLLQALGRGIPFDSAFQQSIFMRYEDFVTMVERK